MQLIVARLLDLRVSPAWIAPTTFVVVLALLVTRLPHALLRAEFWADDAAYYSQALAGGIETILLSYGGALVVVQRLVALSETMVPPALAPLLGNSVALILVAGAATFATSDRMPWSRPRGMLIAFGIVSLPGSFQVLGNLAHAMWPMILFLALAALSRQPSTRSGRVGESAAIAVAGLSGPGALFLWPLFRGRRLALVGACAAVQLVMLVISQRAPVESTDWAMVPEVLVSRVLVAPLIGIVPPFAPLVGAGMAMIAALLLPRSRLGAWIVYIGTVFAIGGVLAVPDTESLVVAYHATRYFWMSGVAWVVLIVAAAPRPLSLVPAALLVGGIVISWQVAVPPTAGWAERSACIGGPVACSVPVAPDERWAVEWRP